MNKSEQIQFVKGLSNRIRDEIVQQIKQGKTLQEWDGLELRCLLAYRHEQSAGMCKSAMKGTRKRCFDNHVICANL